MCRPRSGQPGNSRALYTTGEDIPRTGYEPKPSSTWVVGGVLGQDGAKENPVQTTTSTASVHCAGWEGGKFEKKRNTEQGGMVTERSFATRLKSCLRSTSVRTPREARTGTLGPKSPNWKNKSRTSPSRSKRVLHHCAKKC